MLLLQAAPSPCRGLGGSHSKWVRSFSSALAQQNPQWQQTMLRIRNPAKTIPFYEKMFNMKLLHQYHFNELSFSLYFMATPMPNISYPKPGTKESEHLLWNYPGVTLEFTHNHDATEKTVINNGNGNEHRGFGHIALNTDDVYAAYEELSKKGVKFQKAPNEGKMKGLAFALDPDSYWIELVDRMKFEDKACKNDDIKFNLSQTMIRVKDPQRSLDFYCNTLGMKKVCERHIESGKFSIYFLSSHIEQDVTAASEQQSYTLMKSAFHPFLELTHNWGTEKDDSFAYHNGNDQPQGFGHTGFLVDDLDETCSILQRQKVPFKKLPNEGKMRGIAFCCDPDNYWVELIQRGVAF